MISIVLSKRLRQLVHCLAPNDRVADIGTDHANIPIFLAQNQLASAIIAADIGEQPLAGAKRNIAFHLGVQSQIELRWGNGFSVLRTGEVDSVIVAGMGGHRIQSLIAHDLSLSQSFKRLILQPNNAWIECRQFLWANGFAITDEHLLIEKEQTFLTMVATAGRQQGNYIDAVGGPILRTKASEALDLWLNKRQSTIQGILEANPDRSFVDLQKELDAVQQLIGERTCHH